MAARSADGPITTGSLSLMMPAFSLANAGVDCGLFFKHDLPAGWLLTEEEIDLSNEQVSDDD